MKFSYWNISAPFVIVILWWLPENLLWMQVHSYYGLLDLGSYQRVASSTAVDVGYVGVVIPHVKNAAAEQYLNRRKILLFEFYVIVSIATYKCLALFLSLDSICWNTMSILYGLFGSPLTVKVGLREKMTYLLLIMTSFYMCNGLVDPAIDSRVMDTEILIKYMQSLIDMGVTIYSQSNMERLFSDNKSLRFNYTVMRLYRKIQNCIWHAVLYGGVTYMVKDVYLHGTRSFLKIRQNIGIRKAKFNISTCIRIVSLSEGSKFVEKFNNFA